MKFILSSALTVFTSLLFLSSSAMAENAYARECRVSGGQQWTVDLGQRNDLTLCLFGGAAIGAAEFAHYKWGQGLAQSLRVFLNQNTILSTKNICPSFGASVRHSIDSEGGTWELCTFADGSVIEAGTLAGGAKAPYNDRLRQVLSTP